MDVVKLSQDDIEEVAKKTDWEFELKKDEWLFNEALMLSIGIGHGNEPNRFRGLYFKQTDSRNPILRAEFEERKTLLASTQFAGKIKYLVSSIGLHAGNTITRAHFEPLTFIKWCIEKELKIPKAMSMFCLSKNTAANIHQELQTQIKLTPKKPLNKKSQMHREKCREIAKALWDQPENHSLTIADMILRDDINTVCEGKVYIGKTMKKWVRDLCPNRKPGRRKSSEKAKN